MTGTTTCAVCARTVEGEAPLGWMRDVDLSTPDRRTHYYCPDCARANMRSIEAGLDQAWW